MEEMYVDDMVKHGKNVCRMQSENQLQLGLVRLPYSKDH